ncbi:MAG: hypothetical protein J6N76_00605 [Lachnospiraceae bacterium]|nr:hypothetical protein [Lachnospiraceae bacterium]
MDGIKAIFKNTDPKLKSSYAADPASMTAYNNAIHMLRQNLRDAKRTQGYVADLSYQWFEMAVFGSYSLSINGENFHHGDLHSGNIMVDENGTTVLDYGNCTVLTDKKINQILGMMISVVAGRTDFFVDAFDELLGLAEEDDEKLKPGEQVGYTRMSLEQKMKYEEELKKIFELGSSADSGRKVLLALTKAQELGIKLPREIQNFSQCQQRLENSVEETLDLCKDIAKETERLMRMPVPEKYINSLDPIMQFQRLMSTRNEAGEYRYSYQEAMEEIKERFPYEDIEKAEYYVSNLKGDKESQETFEKKLLPGYPDIETDSALTHKDDFPRIKEAFYKARGYIDKGEAVPEDVVKVLNMAKSYYTVDFLGSDIVSALGANNRYVELAGKAFSYDAINQCSVEAFEAVEYVITEYMPALIKVKNNYDTHKANIKKYGIPEKGNPHKNVVKSRYNLSESLKALAKVRYYNTEEVKTLKARLREIGDPEKEKALDDELIGMRTANMGSFDNIYRDYKNALKTYNDALASGDEKKIEEERFFFENFEKAVLEGYGVVAKKRFDDIAVQLSDTQTAEQLDKELSDFNDEIADCLSTHYLRAGKKLGLKYEPEINRMKRESKEAENKEKAKKEGKEYVKTAKEIEEDKKADEAYKKSVSDYREGRQKRLLELETARIKKANKKSKKTGKKK